MTDGTIHQINTSGGGVPKLPIVEAVVTGEGIEGDVQALPVLHGGPYRALCLFALEVIEQFAAEGHPIGAGSAGENITTSGIDWRLVVPGTRLRLGSEVRIEITGYAAPCKKNARWFTDGNMNRMHHNLEPERSRVYAKVLLGGTLRPGDPIAIEDDVMRPETGSEA